MGAQRSSVGTFGIKRFTQHCKLEGKRVSSERGDAPHAPLGGRSLGAKKTPHFDVSAPSDANLYYKAAMYKFRIPVRDQV